MCTLLSATYNFFSHLSPSHCALVVSLAALYFLQSSVLHISIFSATQHFLVFTFSAPSTLSRCFKPSIRVFVYPLPPTQLLWLPNDICSPPLPPYFADLINLTRMATPEPTEPVDPEEEKIKVHFMPPPVCHLPLSAVCCLLSAVCCLLSAVCCLWSAVCCLLSVVRCVLSAVCCLLSAVCCLLSAVCCLLSAVCRLPFAVCCLLLAF
jgi:hypothetical protein